jgi:RimJ/RimL family protein N-acetyltransferase
VSYFGLVPEIEAEVGYWAHPDARGRGLMTRAMGVVVRHLFEDVGVRRVSAGAAVDNTASRRVIEANGLRPFGVERLGTVVRTGRADIAWYDVLLEEWRGTGRR